MLALPSVVSVSELNRYTRQVLEREFPLLWVSGEISGLTRAGSGHIYFSLKDEAAQVRCVMFRSRAQLVSWRLENGQQIEARVLISLYEPRGDFQLNVESMRRAGQGRLYEAFARLKTELEALGLFAVERKRPLPRYPRCIGIISSPQAAALRDVLVTLRRRAPHLPVVIYPTLVQGDGAAPGVVRAIAAANAHAICQVLLVVRGGGSIEDLWAFNEEIVAFAVRDSAIPVISGVGHETDTSICDFVADLRAPTPTAAAELVTQHWHEAADLIERRGQALRSAIQLYFDDRYQRVDRLSMRLLHPAVRLSQLGDRLNLLRLQLRGAMNLVLRRQHSRLDRSALRLGRGAPSTAGHAGRLALLEQKMRGALAVQRELYRHRLDKLEAALNHLSPKNTLARGFAIVRGPNGEVVTNSTAIRAGDLVSLDLAQGQAQAQVIATTTAEQPN